MADAVGSQGGLCQHDRKSDLQKVIDHIGKISKSVKDCGELASSLIPRIISLGKINNGHPVLDARIHTLLIHLMNLLRFSKLKVQGKSLEGSGIVKRLVKSKLILEHTRSLEEKLKGQIGKLFDAGAPRLNSTVDTNTNKDVIDIALQDPFKFKPSIEDLSTSQPVDGSREEGEKRDDLIYKVPKFFGTELEDDKSKRLSRIENYKNKARQSRIINDLAGEIFDAPEKMGISGTGYSHNDLNIKKDMEIEKEREIYELEHMTRLAVHRKEKIRRKRLVSGSQAMTLDDEFAIIEDDFRTLRRLRYTHNATLDMEDTYDVDGDTSVKKAKKRKYTNSSLSSAADIDLDVISKEAKSKLRLKSIAMEKEMKKLKKKRKARSGKRVSS